MLKLAQTAAASALALVAIVGLGRAGTPPEPPEDPPVATAPGTEEAGQTPPAFEPYTVQPPDLILVEVLEALEGRPISGERLVRPDGRISLGFYGEVYVAGLTISEVKEKIVLHLKKYLSDELLGLVHRDPSRTGQSIPITPKDSDRVFVDVTAYNSQFYYLIGAFKAPDRFHWTGQETIMDAVILAGGLADDADARDVLLVRERPEPGEMKTAKVDVDAILLGSEGAVNHRLQPGDRLIARRLEGRGGEGSDAPPESRASSPAPRARPPRPAPHHNAPGEPTLRDLQHQLLRMNQRLDELARKLDERP